MRILLILRGAPGCGKTTWVKDNHLLPYTLSFDNIRMLFRSPIQTIYGKESSDRKKDNQIFEFMLSILQERMKRGELTVVDAVNNRLSDIIQYNELGKQYKYNTYVVDFTDIPIEVAKKRNVSRMARKRVPDNIIDKIYSEFKADEVSGIPVIKPEQVDEIWPRPKKMDHYKKIHHIGDVHGSLEILKQAISENGNLREDEFYIFLGDYTDRGPDSSGTIEFLSSLKERDNVFFCEGNHERWVWNWLNGINDYPEEFKNRTALQLEESDLDKEDIKDLYLSMKECFYYKYYGKEILACHGGISSVPDNLAKISAYQMIYGVGLNSDIDQIAKTFDEHSKKYRIEIFGHRNPDRKPIKINDSVYCLESGLEDGTIRWLTMEKDTIEEKEYADN